MGDRTAPQCRRLGLALCLSLLLHAVLLSLTLWGDESGLPGFSFPWLERRGAVPDLRVVLIPPPAPAVMPAVTRDDQPIPPAPAGQSAPVSPAALNLPPA